MSVGKTRWTLIAKWCIMVFDRTYTRRNGEKFTVRITLDVEKIADDMARKLTYHGHTERRALAGGVKSEII